MRSSGLLNTPSLQHVVALMRPTIGETKREFELLERAKIDFNYFSFDHLAKPIMEKTFTTEQALAQCAVLKNIKSRKPNAQLVSAFGAYAANKAALWFNAYGRDIYPIASGVGIPINPTGFWVDDGKLKVMWVQKWKLRTLDRLQKAIFHTILDRRVFVGDDFGQADLEWVDFRARTPRGERSIEILNRCHFDTLTDAELKQHLDILLEAFLSYSMDKAERKAREKDTREPAPIPLFEPNPEH